jgi:hypothetical protein
MNTNKTQKWNINKHQQNTMGTNRAHKWTSMNNKTQKGNIDEQQQSTTRGAKEHQQKTTRNNAIRNANKI